MSGSKCYFVIVYRQNQRQHQPQISSVWEITMNDLKNNHETSLLKIRMIAKGNKIFILRRREKDREERFQTSQFPICILFPLTHNSSQNLIFKRRLIWFTRIYDIQLLHIRICLSRKKGCNCNCNCVIRLKISQIITLTKNYARYFVFFKEEFLSLTESVSSSTSVLDRNLIPSYLTLFQIHRIL